MSELPVTSASRDIALVNRVGEGGQISGLDKQLLKMAAQRYTAEQMSEELGGAIDPARCAQRVREIIKSQDILSVTEQKALLLLDMVELRDILFDRVKESDIAIDRNGDSIEIGSDPRHAANLIRLLREFRTLIESSQAEITSAQVMIREAHAQIMLAAIDVVFERFLLRLEQAGHELDRAVAMQAMEEAMPLAFQALEKKTEK